MNNIGMSWLVLSLFLSTMNIQPLNDYVYQLVKETNGELKVLSKEYDSMKKVDGHKYIRWTISKGKRTRREQFDKNNNLFDHLYSPAIVEFKYNGSKYVSKVVVKNADGEKTRFDFGNYCIIKFKYNQNGKIIEERYFDEEGNLVKYIQEIDSVPPKIEYKYKGDQIFSVIYNTEMEKVEGPKPANEPCVPFLTCQN